MGSQQFRGCPLHQRWRTMLVSHGAVVDEAMRIVDIVHAIHPGFPRRFRLADVSASSILLLLAEENIVDRIII